VLVREGAEYLTEDDDDLDGVYAEEPLLPLLRVCTDDPLLPGVVVELLWYTVPLLRVVLYEGRELILGVL
jgi:hypothetical protein